MMRETAETLPTIPLPAGSLVIGDLHLDVWTERPPSSFLNWIAALEGVPSLVILGDLFDAWVGPGHARIGAARAVIEALRELNERGTTVDIVPGNRDFLLDASFERSSAARVRDDGLVGVLADGCRVLFRHGDELCTRDTNYLRLRRVLRAAPLRRLARALPPTATLALARRLRRASSEAVGAKDPITVAQDPAAVRALAERGSAEVLVCGHAHRFRDEELPGGPRWIVLDAFGAGSRDMLVVAGPGAGAADGARTRPGDGPGPSGIQLLARDSGVREAPAPA